MSDPDALRHRRCRRRENPTQRGPGINKSELLVINKIDLAPLVGASLEVMDTDAKRRRGTRPFVFSYMKTGQGIAEIIASSKRGAY